MALPSWPPSLSEAQRAFLLRESSTWALAHGFALLPASSSSSPSSSGPSSPSDPPTSTIAAPLSLLPSPFPRGEYDKARRLQTAYNALYARVALDERFLDHVMADVAPVDAFQAELWSRWRAVRGDLVQPLQLGLFRSDYLLHSDGDAAEIKQVEFNTIAASFGALSQKAGEMHRHLEQATAGFFQGAGSALGDKAAYPLNRSAEGLAGGLLGAWAAYGRADAVVLFVVQPGERNVFDQRGLEYELGAKGVRVLRRTFAELASASAAGAGLRDEREGGPERRLYVRDPLAPGTAHEVAVVYYRAAYTPDDYSAAADWDTRVRIERSAAVKCPSMALQLAGAKKVQQELALPGVLEDFLLGAGRPAVGLARPLTQHDVDALRATWTGLWPLDDSDLGREAARLARDSPQRFVLKPQREGGGNNIYRTDIPAHLDGLAPGEQNGYILMELIEPPQGVHNWLVRGGEGIARYADIVSELGVYGVALFGGDDSTAVNNEVGTLLRTKGRESDEGGVAIGISSIDSPLLV